MWSNKKIWIVGASRGIGASLAKQLNQLGAFVILSARNNEDLLAVKNQLVHPSQSAIITLDLTDPSSLQKASEQYQSEIKYCDGIIHCGGISQRAQAIDTPISVTRKIFESNFFGHLPLTQTVLPGMIQQGSGKIIVISSLTGKWGFYLRSSYSASKHALHGYYDTLRMEVSKMGIDVHIVTPGFIATDISKHAITHDGTTTGSMDDNQANGISAENCAAQIIRGIEKNKEEFGVGGKETLSLFLHRYFPRIFKKILIKQSAR